ncbi:hypothetical protein [Campylobacter fetus]|uniref:hypothetical protein n=1 Tax=Campylobacter fetus TaxID=196 RepID=UPI000FCB0C3A|nr:hypothetical protein [Campylobacter fetus]RUT50970.1 hypothetical protein BWK67_00155 [Campylobacter fetus]RUT51698.1 hypothetical protein BWK51_00155 [Campylobacter fetus]
MTYKCNVKNGGCESLIPSYYTHCPVCGKNLSKKIDIFETSYVHTEIIAKDKDNAFVCQSEFTIPEGNAGRYF